MKKAIRIAAIALCIIVSAIDVNADESESLISKISQSSEGESALKSIDEAISACKSYDDYEKFVSEIKNVIADPGYPNLAIMYYAFAAARREQLKFLSMDNTVESGRLYISVSDQYYDEALGYLDKASLLAKSKELLIDINFIKFLIFSDRLQAQKQDGAFNSIVNMISEYSSDPALNKLELSRMADRLAAKGLAGYSIDLKVAYASRLDPSIGGEIFDEIKKGADDYFSQGNVKEAEVLYEKYIKSASRYFDQETMAAKVMEIAEKYFAKAKYLMARKYYEFYIAEYGDAKLADYSSYKIAVCFYYEKDYAKAIAHLENFISTYQTSIWFDKAFESLAGLYYINFPNDEARKGLQGLVDNHFRKNVGDYAKVLKGLLYYRVKDYSNALTCFKDVDPASIYLYASQTLIDDIKSIRRGGRPSFGTETDSVYRTWDAYKPLNVEVVPLSQKVHAKSTESGVVNLTVKKNTQVKLRLAALEDLDRFAEYLQDKEDLSRLPKKLKEETEKDLLVLQWTCDGGKFSDEKHTEKREWEAPQEPGTYKIYVHVDDFGLVRLPDTGIRKDSARDITIIVTVEE